MDLFDFMPLPAWVVDVETHAFVAVNAAMVHAYGYTRGELLAMRAPDIAVSRGAPLEKHRRKDGTVIDVDVAIHPITYAGRRAMLGIGRDVTAARKLEDQLRQAQRMEAVGQLAGGIAHDFNNVLAVVLSNASLAAEELGAEHPVAEMLGEIETAAARAATLTRQLLAFSRKERRHPKRLALNAIVTAIEAMLARLVGEDITMTAVLAPQLGVVEADPGQLEQVLVNLVVNARDAMPRGGRLVIETHNAHVDAAAADELGVAPGRYVVLAVSDTGCGMTDEVRAHIFEPFYTTKDLGKGTGLGLSSVFGIVKQSGGGIAVTSAVDAGTTFRVYLPRIETERVVDRRAARGTETVLLVEDDLQIRTVLRRYLTSWGYKLLEADNGATALMLADAADPIDVLLTDLVMPGMDGHSLGQRLRALHPELGVVYMSGYTEHPALHDAGLGPDDLFLPKPFSPQALSEMLRRACERHSRRS